MDKYHIVGENYSYKISPIPFFSVILLADYMIGSNLLLHFV